MSSSSVSSSSVSARYTTSNHDPARPFWPVTGALVGLALLGRIVMLVQYVRDDPFARTPLNDADVYWTTAERIAAGKLFDNDPFFSAPLYEYIVGAVRWLGGGLTALYAVQVVVHLGTALLVASIARRRFGRSVGWLAVALFLLLMEPAFFTTRVLNCTWQLALVCLLWHALIRAQERLTAGRWLTAGALLGLNCLATPPMMLLILPMGLWLWWQSSRRTADAGLAFAAMLAAAAVITPVTIHNYRASGVFIPIQAASGVTFRFGNSPGAQGVFSGTRGITSTRQRMHEDARNQFRETFGRDGNWKQIDDYFTRQAWDWLRQDPGRAVKLWALKAYWFLSGHHYGDIYYPTLEILDGLFPSLNLAPLPLPWLIGPALVGAVLLLARPIRYGPELAFLLLPWIVVTAFWYSPRFRFPAAASIVVLAAYALSHLWMRGRRKPGWTALAALVGMMGVSAVNAAANIDSRTTVGAGYALSVAGVWMDQGNLEQAAKHLPALAGSGLDEAAAAAARRLGDLLDKAGRQDILVAWCEDELKSRPDSPEFHFMLAHGLQKTGRLPEALTHFRRTVELRPQQLAERIEFGLALIAADRTDDAIEQFKVAKRLADESGHPDGRVSARADLGSSYLRRNGPGDIELGLHEFEEALHLQPSNDELRQRINQIRAALGLPATRP